MMTKPLTDAELDELEKLDKAATPGPWLEYEGDICIQPPPYNTPLGDKGAFLTTRPYPEPVLSGTPIGHDNSTLSCSDEDRALVIVSRNALPALIDEIRALQAERAALQAENEHLRQRLTESSPWRGVFNWNPSE